MAFVFDKNTIEGGDAGQFHLHMNVGFYLAVMFRSFCFYDLSKVFLGVCARKSNPQRNHLCTIRRLIFLLHGVSIIF